MNEIWKDIEGYEGLYKISNLGRVKSLERVIMRSNGHPQTINEKYLTQCYDKHGYIVVNLWKNNTFKQKKLHQLIAEAFIPNPENKPYIDHINCTRSDNRFENLRWVTHKENMNNPLSKNKMSKTHKWLCTNDKDEKMRLAYARSLKGHDVSEETRKKIAKANSIPILQFSKTGEFIRKWESATEASRELGINPSNIRECCKGKRKSVHNFKWVHEKDYERIPFKVFDLEIYRKKVV